MDIMIDSGHGGSDPGAIGPTGLYEKDCTLAIARKVGALLAENGLHVGFTRSTDMTLSLSERATKANKAGAKYFLSIHINSASNPTANGTETFAYSAGGEGEKLAKAVHAGLVEAIDLKDRGVKYANYAVLRETKMPAALTEVCFICNPAEEALLKLDVFLNDAARGIAKGVLAFFGMKMDEPAPVQAPTTPPDEPNAYAKESWDKAYKAGVMDGTRPKEPMTREQFAVVLDRLGMLGGGKV